MSSAQSGQLFTALILSHDVHRIAMLLNSGVSANALSVDGQPAIVSAAGFGDKEIVRLFLSAGANPNAQAPDGTTALMQAASRGDEQIASDLIHAGADVNARDETAATALIRAAEGRRLALVRLLLDAGADPNAQSQDGRTARSVGAWEIIETRVVGSEYYRRGIWRDRNDPLLRMLVRAGATR